jgi:TctA family transporter
MFDAFTAGLMLVLQWPAMGYLLLGVLIGMFFGAVPGLSGLTALALMLPFTYTMPPATAFAFLLGMFAVTTTSDSITAILLAVPGTVASQATVLDGHPMAVQGQAARAMSAAFTCSMIGGVLGAIFLAVSIPVVRPLILAFASPEFFLVGVLGLTMVGVLSGNNIAKGLVAAMLGLILSFVGYAKLNGIPRFAFGTTYLLDGIPLVPMVLGFFALPELLDLTRNLSISHVKKDEVNGTAMQGIRDNFKHWWVVVRSSIVGIYVGLLPGLGGAIADWAAYGHVVQSSKDKSRFGKGDVRGVLAPESANNAMKGSALIPVIGFGIPGSAPMALLMGAFLIQGLTPGPEMLTTHLDVTFSLVWTLVIANIVAALVLLPLTNKIAALSFIRGHLIFPAVLLFILMGSWVDNNHLADWICLIAFGALGYLMRMGGFPRPPLVLGFILGPVMENAYFLTEQSYKPAEWLTRPICIVLLVLIAVTLFMSVKRNLRKSAAAGVNVTESSDENPVVGGGLTLFSLALFVVTIGAAWKWPYGAALFPLAVAFPALGLGVIALVTDIRRTARAMYGGDDRVPMRALLPKRASERTALAFLLALIGIVLATMLIGQRITLPLFVFLYLMYWAKAGWKIALIYSVLASLFLELMFTRISQVIWYPSLLFG